MNDNIRCFTVGLTGGIASGKTTVSNIFAKLGVPVIDADVIAREVVQPGTQGLNELKALFGKSIISDNGELDRKKLRQIVFNDSNKLTLLNNILHPLIRHQILRRVGNISTDYCIVSIPLLCETNEYKWLDRVLVIDISGKIQKERLMKRDNINNALAAEMIKSQCSREQRLEIANDVLNNEKNIESIKENIMYLHRLYNSLSLS